MDGSAHRLPRQGKRRFFLVFRVLGRVLAGAAALVLLVGALALTALRFERPRAFAAATVDDALSETFRGRLRIERLDAVGLGGLRADVRVEDPAGRTVLRARGVSVRLGVPALLARLLRDRGSVTRLDVDSVHVPHAEVRLVDDGTGMPTLARAFEPRATSPGAGPGQPPPELHVARVVVAHAWVHGVLEGTPWLDAELRHAVAALGVLPSRVSLRLERGTLVSRLGPHALDPSGAVAGTLTIPLDARPLAATATFHGKMAGAGLEVIGSFAAGRVEARAVVPVLDRKTLGRFAPDLLPRGSVHAVVTVTGRPDDLAVTADLGGEPGTVRVRGVVRNAGHVAIVADVDVEALDASAVVQGAPPSSVDAHAHVTLDVREARVSGVYELRVARARVSGEPIPAPLLRGTLEQVSGRVVLAGELRASEPGIEASVRYAVRIEGPRGRAFVSLDATLEKPARLRQIAGVETSGVLSAAAHVAWPEPQLSGQLQARLSSFVAPGVRVGPMSVELDVRGPVSDPSGELDVKARAVVLERFELASVTATLSGRPSQAVLQATLEGTHGERAKLRSAGRYRGGTLELEDPAAVLGDREGSLAVSARRVAVGAKRVEVERAVLDGAGHASGSFAWRGSSLSADLRTERLDVARLARLARVRTPFRSLAASLEAHYDERPGTRVGSLRGKFTDISYAKVAGGTASLELTLVGEKVTGSVDSELVPGSRLSVRLEEVALLPGLAAGDVLGRVSVTGKLDLAGLGPLLGAVPSLPIEKAGGIVDLTATYSRARLDALPQLSGRVRTRGLWFVGKREARTAIQTSGQAIEVEPPVFRGIDVDADLAVEPDARRATLELRLHDRRGELLKLEAAAGPWKSVTLGDLVREAPDVPLEARVVVERRRLRSLPDVIRPRSLRGAIALSARLDGTARDPHLVADLQVFRLTAASERVEGREPPRVDLSARGEVRRAGGHVELTAEGSGARVGQGTLDWSGDLLVAATDPKALAAIAARADVKLDHFDLGTVPALKNRQIGGVLSGRARVEYSEARRTAEVDLSGQSVAIGRARLDAVALKLRLTTRQLDASITARGEGGSLDAKLGSRVRWPPRGVPELAGGARADLAAKRFRLAALWPLLSDSVNELDGRLDADLHATADGDRVSLRGKGRLSEGVVQIPVVGQRFQAIEATIGVEPERIVLRDLRAQGLTGALRGHATLRLDERLDLKELDARVDIAKNQKIPITLEGVAMGDAWGTVEAKLVRRKDLTSLAIRMPAFHLEMPDADRLGVASLEPDERVRVGVRRSDRKFAALPVQPLEHDSERPTPLDISIELGPSVSLRRGDQVTAELTGKLRAEVRDTTRVTGEIELRGGSLDVSGKRFEIERGSVKFVGADPSNPAIFAVARWDSPAGYDVRARYVGTATDGKLTLSSEPPLNEGEILNLILFGTPEGSSGSSGLDSAGTAVGIAGGTATKGINRVLHDFTKLDIQARVDTSTGAARPELVVPLSRRLSARVTRAIGEPTPGASPDRTFLTLELRLKRSWALSALFGDRGASALDLVWRHHY